MSEVKYVYFIKPIGMDGPIKIGCSSDPETRLATLATWSPFPLEVWGKVVGSFKDENFLHHKFSHLHSHREWFRSSPDLRLTIQCIVGGMSIKEACEPFKTGAPIRSRKQPPLSEDRILFRRYGERIRKALRLPRTSHGSYHKPDDVWDIMNDWRCDIAVGHSPIVPTEKQIARLEEFLSDPVKHGKYRAYSCKEPFYLGAKRSAPSETAGERV